MHAIAISRSTVGERPADGEVSLPTWRPLRDDGRRVVGCLLACDHERHHPVRDAGRVLALERARPTNPVLSSLIMRSRFMWYGLVTPGK